MKSSYLTSIFALIVANLIWGAGSPIFKWAFADVPVFTLAFLRYAIPTLFIALFLRKYIPIQSKDSWLIAIAGFFSITLNIGLYFVGIEHTASINAPIIACSGPAFVIIGSMLFLKERPTRKMLLGNLVGLTGVLLIVAEPLLQSSYHASLGGNMLLLFATTSAAIGTLFAKDIIKKYHPITVVFWFFFVGTITFIPFFGHDIAQHGFLTHLHTQGFIGIIYGSVFTSFIAWLLFSFGLEHEAASSTTVFSYLQPIAGIAVAAPLLSEHPSPFFWIGAFFVAAGMLIAQNHKKHHHIHQVFRK